MLNLLLFLVVKSLQADITYLTKKKKNQADITLMNLISATYLIGFI